MGEQLLAGKIACVTGAAGGIGSAICTAFRAAGATVVGADLTDRDGHDLALCDITDESAVAALVIDVVDAHGRLDIMVANAGVSGPVGPTIDLTSASWQHTLDVNLTGTFLTTKYAAKAMAATGGGAIVTTASIMGLRPAAMCAAYSASKAAIISLTRSLGLELREANIRANAVLPGFIDTALLRDRDRDLGAELGIADLDGAVAQLQGRFGEPIDVANLVVYLASDRASYLTGGAYTVDGGLSENLL